MGAAAAVVLLIAPVTVTYQKNRPQLSFVFSPGENRVVPLSNAWCQGTTLYSGSLATVAASMYLLQTMPALTARNNVTITNNNIQSYTYSYQTWTFHLHSGSNYSITACVKYAGYSVQFYVIKGKTSYNAWVENPSIARTSGNYYVLTFNNLCTNNTASLMSSSLTFSTEDDYYFVLYNSITFLVFTLSIERAEYLPTSGGMVSSCTTASFSSCSLSIPYNPDYVILIETSSPTDGIWSTAVSVSASCDARAWPYAVIEISMAIAVVICAISFAAYVRRDWVKTVIVSRLPTIHRTPATPVPMVPVTVQVAPAPATTATPSEKPPDYKDLAPPPYL